MKQTSLGITLVILTALISPVFAGPLKEAKISEIVNDVKVVEPREGARAATLQDVIKDDLGVATGIQSRAELLFQDNTLTRLGAETFFSFQPGTRNLNLERGAMLLQVPKNLGGAHIRAASVSASITGTTIMLENKPGIGVKIVVLEGSLHVGMDHRTSGSMELTAGKMLTVPPDAKELPKPVDVDLHKLVRTSALVNPVLFNGKSKGTAAVLPSMDLIKKEIARQEAEPNSETLATANIGESTNITDNLQFALLNDGALPASAAKTERPLPDSSLTLAANSTATSTGSNTGSSGSGSTPPVATPTPTPPVATPTPTPPVATPTPTPPVATPTPTPPVATPTPSPVATFPNGPAFITSPNPYVVNNTTTFNTAAHTVVTNGVTDTGGIYVNAATSGPASQYLFDTTSAFDTASNFDAQFSIQDQGSAPVAGVAVYRFTNLLRTDAAIVNTVGGPVDLALIGQQSITFQNGGVGHLDSLRSLFLGTVSGPIILANEYDANSNSAFKFLQLYSRGSTGSITIAGKLNTPTSSLFVDAEAGISAAPSSSITAKNIVLNTPGDVTITAGNFTANTAQITAGSSILLNKPLSVARLEATAPIFTTWNQIKVTSGFLNIGAGGIHTNGYSLSGLDTIDSVGGLEAASVTANSYVHVGGELTTTWGWAGITAPDITIGGGVNFTGANGGAGGSLTLQSDHLNITAAGINGIKADGEDEIVSWLPGDDGGTVNLGTTKTPITNNVTVDQPISATTGANGAWVATGGKGGTVNVVAKGSITVNSSVKVSDSAAGRRSYTGGNIKLTSNKTSGVAIAVNNSGELLALLNAANTGNGGTIQFSSAGGAINVNGGRIQADKGTVDIRNNGGGGTVALTNASLSADVVKVGALGANGQLIIGGGAINADTTLHLYGGSGNGQVHFTDNVTLGGASTKIIAGKTVTIDNSKVVTINGNSAAKVFTDNGNYTGSGGNSSTSGQFGGKGATTQGFSKRPSF